MKILGICSYQGTNYYGWQKQVGFISVQSKIEEVLSKIYDSPITIYGSGRTDAGVHALKQYFHFVSDKEKDLPQLMYAMNRMLPEDIQILSLERVSDDFHARYSATKKIYEYDILRQAKNPFMSDKAWLYPMAFDLNLLKEALQKFVGEHCYQDFTSKEEDDNNFVRNISAIKVIEEKELVRIIFEGNGFMRYQIRNMVGAAMSVAINKESLDYIDYHLNNEKREIIAYKSPACGLYLVDVIYK